MEYSKLGQGLIELKVLLENDNKDGYLQKIKELIEMESLVEEKKVKKVKKYDMQKERKKRLKSLLNNLSKNRGEYQSDMGFIMCQNGYCFTDFYSIYYLNNDCGFPEIVKPLGFKLDTYLNGFSYDECNKLEISITELENFLHDAKEAKNKKPIYEIEINGKEVRLDANRLYNAIMIINSNILYYNYEKSSLVHLTNEAGEKAILSQARKQY